MSDHLYPQRSIAEHRERLREIDESNGRPPVLDARDRQSLTTILREYDSLQERIAALTAERGALDKERNDLYTEISVKVFSLDFEVAELRAENATLTADRDLLDQFECIHWGVMGDCYYPDGVLRDGRDAGWQAFGIDYRTEIAPSLRQAMRDALAGTSAARTPPLPEDTRHE